MSNQPPPRPSVLPWFRFAQRAPAPPQPPPPQQSSRPPTIRTGPFGQAVQPPPPPPPSAPVMRPFSRLPTRPAPPPPPPPAARLQTPQPTPPLPQSAAPSPSLPTTQPTPPPAVRSPSSPRTTTQPTQLPTPPAARSPSPPRTQPTQPPTLPAARSPSPRTTQPTPPPTPPAARSPSAPEVTRFGTIPNKSHLQTASPPQAPSREIREQSSPPKPSSTAPPAQANNLSATPPTSSKVRPTLSPPSPFSLPPQMKPDEVPTIPTEAESKRVLVQEKPKFPFPTRDSRSDPINPSYKNIADVRWNKSDNYGKPKSGDRDKKSRDYKYSGRSTIITLAGQNKGAVMEVGVAQPRKQQGSSWTHQRGDPERVQSERSSRTSYIGTTKNQLPPNPYYYMNSNVQGINNSIVFDSSFTEHNPGVHVSHSRRPHSHHKGKGIGFEDHYANARNQG